MHITEADPGKRRGGSGHPAPEVRGGPVSKNCFLALQASIWSTNKGGGQVFRAPPLDPPSVHAKTVNSLTETPSL